MLLNYTTQIDPWQTISEIQQILAKAGATHFSIKNDGAMPAAISFTIEFRGQPLNFSLPCNTIGIRDYFHKLRGKERERLVKSGFMKRFDESVHRIGWRILKDWIEAQCAIINISMASIAEVFMPYLVINEHGQTLADRMLNGNGLKLLTQ